MAGLDDEVELRKWCVERALDLRVGGLLLLPQQILAEAQRIFDWVMQSGVPVKASPPGVVAPQPGTGLGTTL